MRPWLFRLATLRHRCITCIIAVLALVEGGINLPPSGAEPYFEDGFLGLTQKELHDKLGLPQAVRDRKSALRVFTYYPITDWKSYFSKLVSPENGEDVYTFKRDDIDVRYSFSYAVDPNDEREDRPLVVRLVDIEFSTPVPLNRIPSLVPEFVPSTDPTSPAFRSNIWILLFKGSPSPAARFIVKEQRKEQLEWTLAYQLFSLQGLPDRLTPTVMIDRLEISAQSLQLVQQRQRHTHEPTLNPYSPDFIRQAVEPPKTMKPVPVPKYAE
ncbi:MAG: hypothetical protein NNA18_08305 [Nitrospira sp.]|nr:hypothetical protein [Nitrospira sp.]